MRLFWVPAPLRGEQRPEQAVRQLERQPDRDNTFGIAPDGTLVPNGVDVYWDEQGVGNCWQGNGPRPAAR